MLVVAELACHWTVDPIPIPTRDRYPGNIHKPMVGTLFVTSFARPTGHAHAGKVAAVRNARAMCSTWLGVTTCGVVALTCVPESAPSAFATAGVASTGKHSADSVSTTGITVAPSRTVAFFAAPAFCTLQRIAGQVVGIARQPVPNRRASQSKNRVRAQTRPWGLRPSTDPDSGMHPK